MTAPRSRICVMQIPRTPPTQNYSQANSADINAPARCPFFCYFSLGKQRKVDLKLQIQIVMRRQFYKLICNKRMEARVR